MKTTLMTIAFATASMFAAQTPAPKPPAAATTQAKPAVVKTKTHHKAKAAKESKDAAPVAAAKVDTKVAAK